jgi:hypothetical protein
VAFFLFVFESTTNRFNYTKLKAKGKQPMAKVFNVAFGI